MVDFINVGFNWQNHQTPKDRSMIIDKAQKYLLHNEIKAFCSVIDAVDFDSGVRAMLQVTGVGKMRPNLLLMGYKNDWRTCDIQSLERYFTAIQLEPFLISLGLYYPVYQLNATDESTSTSIKSWTLFNWLVMS